MDCTLSRLVPDRGRLVVKLGGAAGIGGSGLLDDLASVAAREPGLVLVHGGSDATTRLQERLGAPARFLESPSGHMGRDTDRAVLAAFAMATALLNRELVEGLGGRGVRAFGLSGLDGGLVRGRRKAATRARVDGRLRVVRDQWTGAPRRVEAGPLEALLAAGCLPVVAPLIAGEGGEMLNADGDRLAASLAGGLGARVLVILTNVPGLLENPEREDSLVERVTLEGLADVEPLARGRMRKKLLGAREALERGVETVVLADARRARPLESALAGRGTVIGAPLGGVPAGGRA